MNPTGFIKRALRDPLSAFRCVRREAPQWAWFLRGIDPARVGYGWGPLTWWRQRRHRCLDRPVHICLLQPPGAGVFGRVTAFWINERSSCCRASVNEGLERADVVWTYCQDPLSEELKGRLRAELRRARPGARVINHPDSYNCYHEPGVFSELARAGVSVPRTEFTEADVGRTMVVYKKLGAHTASKALAPYDGPRPGHRAFEFVDCREVDGCCRRYRSYYVAGVVWPTVAFFGREWNIYSRTAQGFDYSFTLTPAEERCLRLIAETLDIQFFAADHVRRREDGAPVFLDINIYPSVVAIFKPVGRPRDYGLWHAFDSRERFGGTQPAGAPFRERFDQAMLALVGRGKPLME